MKGGRHHRVEVFLFAFVNTVKQLFEKKSCFKENLSLLFTITLTKDSQKPKKNSEWFWEVACRNLQRNLFLSIVCPLSFSTFTYINYNLIIKYVAHPLSSCYISLSLFLFQLQIQSFLTLLYRNLSFFNHIIFFSSLCLCQLCFHCYPLICGYCYF